MGAIKFPEEQNAKVSPFRKTLLNRCQKEFFREKSDEGKLIKNMDALQARSEFYKYTLIIYTLPLLTNPPPLPMQCLLIQLPSADLSENEKQAQVEELLYQRSELKRKMLGNINFIGELFNLGMLSSKIIISQVRL